MLFTFPSRYWYAIGLLRVFSLAGWSRRIHAGFHVSRATQDTATPRIAACTQLSCSVAGLSRPFHSRYDVRHCSPTTPARPEPRGFGLLPFRSPLLGESLFCFLFLRVLRCFSSPRLPPQNADDRPSACRVVPFGDPRITGHLHLPAAFRSLSRPSSPVRA